MSELDRYREALGREPERLPADHPDAWQWEYRGSKKEREALIERMSIADPDDEAPVVIEGQQDMFGDAA